MILTKKAYLCDAYGSSFMEIFWNIVYWVFMAIYVYAIMVVLLTILMENRNPVKTLAWVTIMVLLPVVGIILYIFFGKNFRRKKIIANKMSYPPISTDFTYNLDRLDESGISPRFHKIVRLLNNNSNAVLFPGNKIDVYTTGHDTFEALFHDIENAKENIHIEFYIIANDDVGNKLHDILVRKAKEGVRVRVVCDYLGSWKLPYLWLKSLRDAGVYFQPFLTTKSIFGFSLINYRNHRKSVIIDGRIAYTGGVNIAERYRKGNRLGLWRDTFIRLQGPAVQAMQYNFAIDWNFVDGKPIIDKKYYPTPEFYDHNYVQIVTSGPDSDWQSIMQGVLSAIANAKNSIYIHTPYYMPPESVVVALETAAMSGVDVRIMIPERNDSLLVSAAGRSYIEQLLRAGIRVYYYQHNFLHSKAIVVDDEVSIVGTANMDNRSYEQNFEIAAFIYDRKTACTLTNNFRNDMTSSRELNINLWRHRPKHKRYLDSLARLLSPLL